MAKRKVYIDYTTGTTFLQAKKTGLMKGRKKTKGMGDRTAIRRVKTGEIYGRTPAIPTSVLVKKHKRRSKKGRRHVVRKYRR